MILHGQEFNKLGEKINLNQSGRIDDPVFRVSLPNLPERTSAFGFVLTFRKQSNKVLTVVNGGESQIQTKRRESDGKKRKMADVFGVYSLHGWVGL